MPISKITIPDFLPLAEKLPVLDVRSPGEYAHAHIPQALSFPLFSNEERKVIGTAYKQESREKAIKIGLDWFGKNLVKMVEEAEKLIAAKSNPNREVVIHCWRGGMRSAAVAWLLDLYGFKVYLLQGGYKAYRRWALEQFEKEYPLGIIGGYTGSNKTGIIEQLKKTNEYVIDLEGLAAHKGSAFGNLEQKEQPSQEQFENLLALGLYRFSTQSAPTLWLEFESQRIGNINIPLNFFNQIARQPYYFIEISFEERLKHILEVYGKASKESLINAIVRITKKLGGLEAKTAINFLMDDDIAGCFSILLNYYDKLYHKNEAKRKQENRPVTVIACPNTNAEANLKKLLEHANRK